MLPFIYPTLLSILSNEGELIHGPLTTPNLLQKIGSSNTGHIFGIIISVCSICNLEFDEHKDSSELCIKCYIN
jgi:hypothetical protein